MLRRNFGLSVVVMATTAPGIAAAVVPKRCFPDESAIREFRFRGLLERNYKGELKLLK